MVLDNIDAALAELEDWKNSILESCYIFEFVDWQYTTMPKENKTKK